MKKIHYIVNIAAILQLFVGLNIYAQEELEKIVKEEFSVNNNTCIDINTKFSNVEIFEEEGETMKVKAVLSAKSTSPSKTKEILDKINVSLEKTGNTIYVKTNIDQISISGGDSNFEINITINAPKSIDLNINAKFGSVFIEENSGFMVLNLAHGNASIGSLERGNEKPLNEIILAHSKASIDEADWLKLNSSFSKVNIEEATAIILISKYSGVNIEECSSIVTNSKYDTYRIEELNNFDGELKYSNLKIDELAKKFEYHGSFSSATISETGSHFEYIKIDNSLGSVKIGLAEEASFTFSGTANKGDISIHKLDDASKKVEGTTKIIEGSKGSNPNSHIEVISNKGSVSFIYH